MKLARRHNRIVKGGITTVLLLVSSYGVFRYAHTLIAQAPLTVMHESLLAENYQQELEDTLTHAIYTQGPTRAVATPANYSPLISSIQIRYKFPYHGIVQYATVEPYAQLNHAVIALASGALVPATTLCAEDCASLPEVHVSAELLNESHAPELLRLFLKNMTVQLAERFSCEWHDQDTCYYRDTEHKQYTLVADGHTPISEADIQLYDAVVQQSKSERISKKWVVDIRFKGQVVVTPDGGV